MKLTRLKSLKDALNRLNNSRPEQLSNIDDIFDIFMDNGLLPDDFPREAFKARYEELANMGETNALRTMSSLLSSLPVDEESALSKARELAAGAEIVLPELNKLTQPKPDSGAGKIKTGAAPGMALF